MAANRRDLPDGLLDDVKNYLNITWDDDATDKKGQWHYCIRHDVPKR